MGKHSINVFKNTSAASVTMVGIDLAKNVFAVHGINAAICEAVIRPNMRSSNRPMPRPP